MLKIKVLKVLMLCNFLVFNSTTIAAKFCFPLSNFLNFFRRPKISEPKTKDPDTKPVVEIVVKAIEPAPVPLYTHVEGGTRKGFEKGGWVDQAENFFRDEVAGPTEGLIWGPTGRHHEILEIQKEYNLTYKVKLQDGTEVEKPDYFAAANKFCEMQDAMGMKWRLVTSDEVFSALGNRYPDEISYALKNQVQRISKVGHHAWTSSVTNYGTLDSLNLEPTGGSTVVAFSVFSGKMHFAPRSYDGNRGGLSYYAFESPCVSRKP